MWASALAQYLDARQSASEGKLEEAAALLEMSIGSPPENPVIRHNLNRLLDHHSHAGEALLHLVAYETTKGERK